MELRLPGPGQSAPSPAPPHRSVVSVLWKVALHTGALVVGVVAYIAHEHFAMAGASTASVVSLVAAAGFGLMPLRGLLGELLSIEGKVVHLAHGVAGLGLVGLTAGGVVSGGPLLSHAAMAPFALMGAAQAMEHQNRPRNAAQAAALRNFATSLPEVAQFTSSGNLRSPANAQRAVTVLTDLVDKAEVLGETELQADPGFQGALRQTTTRMGLSLGLDAIDRAIGKLANNPATSGAVPGLRKRLAAVRKAVKG